MTTTVVTCKFRTSPRSRRDGRHHSQTKQRHLELQNHRLKETGDAQLITNHSQAIIIIFSQSSSQAFVFITLRVFTRKSVTAYGAQLHKRNYFDQDGVLSSRRRFIQVQLVSIPCYYPALQMHARDNTHPVHACNAKSYVRSCTCSLISHKHIHAHVA